MTDAEIEERLEKLEESLHDKLNALEQWFRSQSMMPFERLMLCQIYCGSIIEALADDEPTPELRTQNIRIGLDFVIGTLNKTLNGGYGVMGIKVDEKLN
jgi:hypothetical protein